MKKTFKFFMMAAIVAAGFTACSSEEGTPNETVGGGQELPSTYATFKFDDSGNKQSKALTSDANESKLVNSFRVIIFGGNVDPTSTPQVDESTTTADPLTVYLETSGLKKIFVVANDVAANLKPKGSLTYADLSGIIDVGTTLANLTKVKTNANPSVFVMSNAFANCDYTLASGISEEDSKLASSENNIVIDVKRLIAKLRLALAGTTYGTTSDGKGGISDVSYRMWNVNSGVFPIEETFAPYGGTADFDKYGDRVGIGSTGTDFITVTAETAAPAEGGGGYYYVTENKRTLRSEYLNGNTTYAAVKAIFTPKATYYYGAATQFTNVGNKFTIEVPTMDAVKGADFWKLDSIPAGFSGLVIGAVYANPTTVKQITHHFENDGLSTLVTDVSTVVESDVEKYFTKYVGGVSWYRLNIGSGDFDKSTETESHPNYTYGIERNSYYWAQIEGFSGLGAATEEDLEGDPKEPVEYGPTYLTVSVKVLPWEYKGAGVIL
ncbi:hypothetical protein M2459_002884 [Parabacteroides sp. PF5-5]|uniref:Mfa1 family fimbria major subunit n=1 Tax=unclassified Parabacteroides TaxID=2649774 RepID=UPI0024744BFE|nr:MULTISPECIES: Mfa1 family fimbria major subunit [unclassified Parabacteroides]MDH6306170.1 hypothetical protein [Parabacteroides sp. PH5-39]MDH6317129.1 hypothetical protein [Parabacteroides sp. PF5-13]MDH6320882.1 hypothetical protein [Parabacteroides sp. PH5-13]MDH6324613.1 hypothetical protein [Parabacteroides sp. PH5-8]MDH6328336.1 hypothetical protein [Parabacteroides sp. PH5-41]